MVANENNRKFEKFCIETLFRNRKKFDLFNDEYEFDRNWQLEHCEKYIKDRYKQVRDNHFAAHLITLPGGAGRLHAADLGVMGNVGMLLLLAWTYFAMRRENHAIKALVDFDRNSSRSFNAPTLFMLKPQDNSYSAEHYVFAYRSISHRFLFILSTHSRPLILITSFLVIFPCLVSGVNLFSNARVVASQFKLLEFNVIVRFVAEIILFGLVTFGAIFMLRLVHNTSALLNGWHLAVRDVWADEWNEQDDKPASEVTVNRLAQKAKRVKKKDKKNGKVNPEAESAA